MNLTWGGPPAFSSLGTGEFLAFLGEGRWEVGVGVGV
jgi:hypothetical protein